MKALLTFLIAFAVALPASAQTSATVQTETTVRVESSTSSAGAAAGGSGTVTTKPEEASDMFLEIKGVEGEAAEGTPGKPKYEDIKASVGGASGEAGEKGGTEDINIDVGELQGNAVSVSAVEVRGWDPKEKQEFLATVKTHAQVRSEQDLENFATGILLKDENVEEISSDEDSVEVRYRVPAKFLGIFETSIPVIVVAEKAQGELGGGVKVRFPWYRVLFGVEEEVSETSLESDIGAAVIADLDSDGALDVSVAARIYTAISNVLKTKHDTVKNSVGNIR